MAKNALNKEEVRKLIEDLNEGTILFSDLPEEFRKNREKFRIPVKPREPEAEECCGTGCRPCVFDLYEKYIERYEEDLDKLYYILYG